MSKLSEKTRYAVIHDRCGAVVFYLSEKPKSNFPLKNGTVTTVNGERIKPGVTAMCPFCHDTVRRQDLRIEDMSH